MRQAQVNKAKWQQDGEGTWICFRVPAETAAGMVQDLAEGKDHTLVLKRQSKKRSLDANAYFWVMVNALSEKIGVPSKNIYREYIRDIGGNAYVVPVKTELVSRFCDEWVAGHDGRIAEDMGPARTAGYNNVRIYIGSSDYDTAQMSRLIDLVVEDCKTQGIETLTPRDKELLMQRWDHG